MKILMLSWEYPPKNVGGLSNHVYHLSNELSKLGNEVHVITCEEGTAPIEENENGIFIYRVTPYKIDTNDFTKWVMHLNFAMIEEAIRLINNQGKFDIIHVHDWLCSYAAKTLKWSYTIPTICTIHSTEHGRNNGIRTDMQRYISSAEWLLSYESSNIIVCSKYMKNELENIFKIPTEKINIISNGIDIDEFSFEFNKGEFRKKYAKEDEKIIFFVGRHVYEKGLHVLVETAPEILKENDKVKFIIAGTGFMTEELKDRVTQMKLEDKIIFIGYIDDFEKNKLYKVANAVVVPSIYEPFGIVALEAMAAGCPVIVSNTGGLLEIVNHKVNGLTFINESRESLKDNVCELLEDKTLYNRLRRNALKEIQKKYSWHSIGKKTEKLYLQIK